MSTDPCAPAVDEATAATPTSETPPLELAWGDEPAPGDSPTGTTSWRLVAALAVSVAISALLLVGGAWAWTHRVASEPLSGGPTPATTPTPPVAPPPTTTVAAPPVTVTVTPPPTTIQAAVPQVPAAAKEICDMLRQYPGMKRVDVALTLVMDRHVYYDYDTARPIVDNAVANYCPDQAR